MIVHNGVYGIAITALYSSLLLIFFLVALLMLLQITLDFPRERLVLILGYIGIKYGEEVVRSLTVKTNLQTHPTYGNEKGERFQLPQEENCGRIIGFHGTSGRFLNSLGARLEPF